MTSAMFEAVRIYLYVFGALTIAGGVVGFVKAKSKASLVAGGTSGVLLLGAAYVMAARPTFGLGLGLIVSLGLAGRFISAFRKSGKLMPAGMMAVLGTLGVCLTAAAFLSR
jgi:uncharacterized membrane protein (UPF0136 family)